MIRITIAAMIAISAIAKGESYLFKLLQPDLKTAKIEGNKMHVSVDLIRLPNPDVGGIEVDRGENNEYLVRTYIKEPPERGWFPMLKLEDKIIEISKVTNTGPNFSSYFEIEFTEKKPAIAMAKNLAALFKVPEQRVAILADKTVTEKSTTNSGSGSKVDD